MMNSKFNSFPEKDGGRLVQGTTWDIPDMNHYNIIHPISLYISFCISRLLCSFFNLIQKIRVNLLVHSSICMFIYSVCIYEHLLCARHLPRAIEENEENKKDKSLTSKFSSGLKRHKELRQQCNHSQWRNLCGKRHSLGQNRHRTRLPGVWLKMKEGSHPSSRVTGHMGSSPFPPRMHCFPSSWQVHQCRPRLFQTICTTAEILHRGWFHAVLCFFFSISVTILGREV